MLSVIALPGSTSQGATSQALSKRCLELNGGNDMAEIHGYPHLSLSVTDLGRSVDWYRSALDLAVDAEIEVRASEGPASARGTA